MERRAWTVTGTLLLCAVFLPASEPGGWVSLFDGNTLRGWQTRNGKAVVGWIVVGGTLHMNPETSKQRGDIFTVKEYRNFVLQFEWKIAPRGNSGVKYRMAWYGKSYLGPEYQLLGDSQRKPSQLARAKGATGALYDLIPPDPAVWRPKPEGQWNLAKIVAQGPILEHWLNGKRLLRIDITSERFKKALSKSKFRRFPTFARSRPGRIMLQDHGSKVWFRNLRIKELK